MAKKSGPVIGSARAPLIQAAGNEHIICSKKLVGVAGSILLVTAIIFFSVEQSNIEYNLSQSRMQALENNKLRAHVRELLEAKMELQAEEDQMIELYDGWMDEDAEEQDMTSQQLDEFRASVSRVAKNVNATSVMLAIKEDVLKFKEDRLKTYQHKIQIKTDELEKLADIIQALNKTRPPVGFNEDHNTFIWDDDLPYADFEEYEDEYDGDWIADDMFY